MTPKDLFDGQGGDLTPELRKELMDIRKAAAGLVARIDALTERRGVRELDDNGEPTFRFLTKVIIPKDFTLTQRLVQYALDQGFDREKIMAMGNDFVRFYNKSGRKWQDWSRVWMDWVRNEKKIGLAPKAKTTDTLPVW